jgi:serine/threonine protein kinase
MASTPTKPIDTPPPNPDRFEPLAGFSPEQAGLFRSKLVECAVKAGDTIIRAGDPGDCLYVIREGLVEVRAPRAAPADTEVKVLARLGPGNVIGEMALLNREPRNADVVALDDGVLCRLAAADFDALCAQLPVLKLFLTRLVAHRLSWSGADLLARRIGNYSVIARLGGGGMGWVFRAVREQERPGQPAREQVAIKMLPHTLATRPGFLERFRQEADVMARVRHENIVTLYEAIEAYGTMFLALEYVRGMTVREWVARHGQPSVDDVRRIARATIRALQAAHDHNVIHRDVKPDNLMLREDGAVKLMDFGIAVPVSGPTVSLGGVSLTPVYAAPELFGGARGDPSADYYSLGVMLYELLAGRLPLQADTFNDWALQHMQVEPPPLRQVCPSVPDDLDALVRAALIKDPQSRRTSVQAALEVFASQSVVVRRPPVMQQPAAVAPASAMAADASTVVTSASTAASPAVVNSTTPSQSGAPTVVSKTPTIAAVKVPAAPRVVAAPAPAPQPKAVAVAEKPPLLALWLKLPGEAKEHAFLMTKPLIIGRDPTADICIPDRAMSRHHAEIASTPQGIRVRDLKSSNGTFLNDQPVTEILLRRGDRLQVGLMEITFESESATGVHFGAKPLAV